VHPGHIQANTLDGIRVGGRRARNDKPCRAVSDRENQSDGDDVMGAHGILLQLAKLAGSGVAARLLRAGRSGLDDRTMRPGHAGGRWHLPTLARKSQPVGFMGEFWPLQRLAQWP
jgi:hypothetical protein